MQKHRTAGSHRDQNRPTTTRKNKENPVADTVFLIQNQNEVLRMKNNQLNAKIKQLKMQLNVYSDSIALRERQIDDIKNQISSVSYKQDIQIENQKKLLTEKLVLLKSNQEIIFRKIKQAREATIFQEQKIAEVQRDRKSIEMEILSMKAQNEGTKIILRNLQEQNEKLRFQNEALISKRKINEPKEKQISIQIQQRIRLIKNQQQSLKSLRRYQTAKLINSILSIIYSKKLKDHFTAIDRKGLLSKIAKKKVIQMGLIRKKYLNFIKVSILEKLRSVFKPLIQQQTAKRIISEAHKRRVRAFIWRKWRTAAKNAEFATMRKFQFQNLLQKLTESFNKSNLFSAFNLIKYFRNDPFRQGAVSKIESIFNQFMNRCKRHFFSNLRTAQRKFETNLQIKASSNEQSKLLVRSFYFSAWVKLAKSKGIENKSLKRRYFNQLKKMIALKNRRKLGQMLIKTNEKINNIDIQSKVFAQMKKDTAVGRLQSLYEQKQSFEDKTMTLKQELDQIKNDKKQLYQQLALIKVSKYLKTKVQKAFDIWRLRKQQSKVLLSIINMVQSKKACDKNFAFAQILKKRFAMLKKSIRDKIQSCQFSYNYLLDQNKHIKEVLDTKQHELEKSKFMNLLKKMIRNEKEIKLKYLYKFMRSGYKFWKFRKVCHRIDTLVEKKAKVVFFWILKADKRQVDQESRIQNFVQNKQRKMNQRYCRLALKGFQVNQQRNRRFRRVMGGIFQRNLELDFYVAFGKIRNEEHLLNRAQIQAEIDEVQKQIDNRNAITAQEENNIVFLKNRFKQKEQILLQRKILGLYQFYVKNIKTRFGSYLRRWRDRVIRQKRVTEFAEILQRKTRIMLKNKFMLNINKKNEDYTLDELQQKLGKFKHELEHLASNQQKFIHQNQKESQRMKNQNEFFKKQGDIFQKKTDFMTNIRLKSFEKEWAKKILKVTFREWRNQTDIFIGTWTKLNSYYTNKIVKETFEYFSKEMKQEVFNAKLRKKLDRIYTKKYRYNIGFGFQTWRLVYLNKMIKIWQEEEKKQMKRFQGLEAKYKYAVNYHNKLVDYRYYEPKIRSWWNNWRIYTQNKIFNNSNKQKLGIWLFRGYSSQFLRILKKRQTKKIEFKGRLNNFKKKWQILRMKALLYQTSQNKHRRNRVIRLFINKFCPFMIYKTQEDFFTRVKNYGNNRLVNQKMQQTDKIQFLIEKFQKKRKGTLNFYLRRWKRNQYEMRIAKNLMRKITRNAMNWRVKDSFYNWKLQCQAKRVKQMHEEEGEVKKRKIEIRRLKIFLQDFKKEKGLLLEDEAGTFVLSPRFQEKKDMQIKKDNNLRYKFISRLILSMNGYAAPIKAWNNLKIYTLIRQNYRKFAKFAKNMLRKPDLYHAFKIWHKASTQFAKMFQTMQRKDLIKILNKQKDKMEMQYSKKVSLQDKIQQEMRAHKLLSYQQDKKEKLCGHVLLKNLRKIKLYSLLAWKDRVRQMKEVELASLEEQGNNKINNLEQEVNQLDQIQRELQQNNQKLQQAVREALEIAEMVKRITQQRDILSNLITQKQLTCESLQQENEQLNAKLYQAQKQAMNLLILSGDRL